MRREVGRERSHTNLHNLSYYNQEGKTVFTKVCFKALGRPSPLMLDSLLLSVITLTLQVPRRDAIYSSGTKERPRQGQI